MDQAEEIRQLIESAKSGYWYPIVLMASVFSIIVALLLVIWNQMIRNNNVRHKKTEDILKATVESQQQIAIIVNRHDVEIEHLKNQG